MTRTWELSLDGLAAGGRPQARPLLRVLSCLAPAVLIPPGMLDLAALGRVCQDGEDGAADGLAALASVGLITTSPGSAGTRPGLTVHPLVTETSRLHLDAEDPAQTGGIAVALLTAAAARLGHDQPWDWPAWIQLVPHLNAVYGYLASRLTDDDLAALAEVTVSVALAFVWAGSYFASQELAESALQHAARLGARHLAVLSLRSRVASAHMFRGWYAQAEHEYRGVLAAGLRVLGPDHPSMLATQHQLARMLGLQGRYADAQPMFRQVLAAQRRTLGDEHPDTLTTGHRLAWLIGHQGRFGEATEMVGQVLGGRRRILGDDHPDTLAARETLAWLTGLRGKLGEADELSRSVLADRRRTLGDDHPDTLTTRATLAWLIELTGRYAVAEQLYRDLLADQQRVLGDDHPDRLTTRHEIARMLASRGLYEQAEQEYRDVLIARLRVLGPDHPSTLATGTRSPGRSRTRACMSRQNRNTATCSSTR